MQRLGYGLLGLRPDQFWDLTIGQFNAMIEAKMEFMRHEQAMRTRIGMGIVQGHRVKRVNWSRLTRDMMGDDKTQPELSKSLAGILKQSQSRVSKAQGRHGDI